MGVHAPASSAPARPAPPPTRTGSRFENALLRVRARVLASRLDARLASRDAPDGPLLTARSRQLVTRRERERLASALEHVCRSSAYTRGFSTAIPVDATAVRVAAPAMAQLAHALRVRDAVAPRGVALSRLLLTEPASPVYRPAHRDALYEAARRALLAL